MGVLSGNRGVGKRFSQFFCSFFRKIKRDASPQNSCRSSFPFFCSGVLGCSALPMLTSLRTRNFLSLSVLTTQGCETHPSTPPPDGPSGPGIGKFQTGGPPCTTPGGSIKIGNSGLTFIEGRHQPRLRFGARTFMPEVMGEHRVRYKHHLVFPCEQKFLCFFTESMRFMGCDGGERTTDSGNYFSFPYSSSDTSSHHSLPPFRAGISMAM